MAQFIEFRKWMNKEKTLYPIVKCREKRASERERESGESDSELCASAKVLEMLESEPKAVLMLRLLFLSPRHEKHRVYVLCLEKLN